MINRLLLLSILLFTSGFISFSYIHKATINTPVSYLTTDNLGNIYTVNNDVLSKFYPNGELFKTYNNKTLGKITYIDATNAMRPLVFYRDFYQVVFLDNTLTANGPVIDLLNLNFRQPQMVCTSSNNGIWVFDQLTQELYRLNQNFEITNKSGNLVQVLGNNINPIFLTEYNNMVYMSDDELGIMVFDIFGNYQKTIPIKSTSSFQITEDRIYFTADSVFYNYDFLSFEKEQIGLPEKKFTFVRVEDNLLYISTKDTIKIFEIK